jgi:hypothetical protein
MRKYGACLAALAAFMLIGPTAVAGAQARATQATQAKHSFIVIGRHNQRVSLYVQRSHRGAGAHSAACLAGNTNSSYCTPPVQQNLFGAYASSGGSVTFGSTNSSTCKALGWSGGPCGVYTTAANTLIGAFVGGSGSSGQSISVSCKTASGGTCPVTFHKVSSSSISVNGHGGDSEFWYADATNVIPQSAPIFVTATATKKNASDVSLQAITFLNAITAGATGPQGTGIGSTSACSNSSGAPTCTLKTSEPNSFVWAAANDPSDETIPTWPTNQFAVGVASATNDDTFYSQFLGTCTANANGSKPCTPMTLPASGLYQNPFKLAPTATPLAGTPVTINDTAPTREPYDMVVVEIL